MVVVRMPIWGFDMTEGEIVRWLKEEGDTVKKGEPLVEVETEKVICEVEALEEGSLRKIMAKEGAVVPVGGILGIIASPQEEIDIGLGVKETLRFFEKILQEEERKEPSKITEKVLEIGRPEVKPSAFDKVKASPVAKKLAEEFKKVPKVSKVPKVPKVGDFGRGFGPRPKSQVAKLKSA